jgi:hypothetical protein
MITEKIMKNQKTNTPPHKSRVWQPFPASLASLPNTAFFATAPALLKSFCNLIIFYLKEDRNKA